MTDSAPRGRRPLTRVLAFIGTLAALAVLLLANRLGYMLTGYKAKMLCSQVFVAGRSAGAAVRDLEADDLWVLPAGWVEYSRTPTPADPARAFGAHLWARLPDDYAASQTPLPAGSFHAAGHEGQFITIVPSRRVVIVRLGRTRDDGAWDQSRFVADVLEAMSH